MEEYPVWPGWKTVKLLGRGSYGGVYEIERVDMFGDTEKAAMKMISIPQSESEVDELRSMGYDDASISTTYTDYARAIANEYKLMRQLNGNTNIVNCDDYIYTPHKDGLGADIAIKMELLTPLLKATDNRSAEELAVRVGKDICNALILCEQNKIIHRDIKPQNIFVSPSGSYKLGDFGVSKTMERTSGGTKTGTPDYMAPEVFRGDPYNRTVDIYSLGIVLYWLLNEKRTPFLPLPPQIPLISMRDEARARRMMGEQIPAPIHGSAELKRIVLKACAFRSEDRYQTADEMLRDLKQVSIHGDYPTEQPVAGYTVTPTPDVLNDGNHTVGVFGGKPVQQPVADDTEDGTVGVFAPKPAQPATLPEDDGEKTTGMFGFAGVPTAAPAVSNKPAQTAEYTTIKPEPAATEKHPQIKFEQPERQDEEGGTVGLFGGKPVQQPTADDTDGGTVGLFGGMHPQQPAASPVNDGESTVGMFGAKPEKPATEVKKSVPQAPAEVKKPTPQAPAEVKKPTPQKPTEVQKSTASSPVKKTTEQVQQTAAPIAEMQVKKKKSPVGMIVAALAVIAAVLALVFVLPQFSAPDSGKTSSEKTSSEKVSSGKNSNEKDSAEEQLSSEPAVGAFTTIKLGGQGPLSGPAAIYGISAMRGAEVAVNEINEKAGTTVFELKYEDDEHDVSKAPNAYNALKDWGMQISLGAVTSKLCAAIGPFTAEDNIFALTPSASSDVVPVTSGTLFQMCFSDNNQGSGSAVYMAAHMPGAKIAIIYESDLDYSVGIANSFRKKAAELNLLIVSEATFIANDIDFSAQIQKAKIAGADLVFMPIYYNEAALILAQANGMGYAPTWFGVDGMDGILYLDGFDTALAEGLYMLTPFDANAAVSKNFVDLYQKAYGETPIQFAADAYDSVYAIYAAVQAKGITGSMATADITAALVDWFTTGSFSGITGTDMTWDKDGFVSKQPMCVVVKNGVFTTAE